MATWGTCQLGVTVLVSPGLCEAGLKRTGWMGSCCSLREVLQLNGFPWVIHYFSGERLGEAVQELWVYLESQVPDISGGPS